ncbi:MAG: glycosyltransferase family 2 protein [Prolixibacteraceae bacterium]|jgi:cellulose synthase/poly-beta-1,6-N-acetylglucosamine synthase-like glycosyltransferase|nr:glycosyltransferase family 2 protein [Prolixibacteraceae bacterium]
MLIHILTILAEAIILVYAIAVFFVYFALSILSGKELLKYFYTEKITNFDAILSSPFAPTISIIAPAYNESVTIVENIRALLSLYYPNFEIIIVNDGSKDDTLNKTIDAYELEKVPYVIDYKIECKEIVDIYKSKKKAFNNLTVINKLNGGKADALNAGINIAKGQYFIAIDVDSIIDPYALQKLVLPFLTTTDARVIATGGVIRIANSCKIKDGQLIEINVPDDFLPRCQVIEYNRAFLLGRLAWSRLDGLILISGALGLFDKEIAIACGGYYPKTVGEDMEIVVRMRKYMAIRKEKYKVAYLPEPLCWTEAPSSLKILGSQRNRWTRGTIDTIFLHKDIFFNPNFGTMGMLSFPYWVFFEWLAPIIETLGMLYFILLAIFGFPNWIFFSAMFFFVYFFSISFSSYAILYDHLIFHRYKKKRMILKLLVTSWVEPFFYHPMVTWWALRGNWDYFVRKKKAWGKMTREGFSKGVKP